MTFTVPFLSAQVAFPSLRPLAKLTVGLQADQGKVQNTLLL